MSKLSKSFVIFTVFILLFSSFNVFASGKNYTNWTEIAEDMSVHLNNAITEYEKNTEEGAKAAVSEVNTAYFKFYEKLGFEKTVMSVISGQRGTDVEHYFYRAKKIIRSSGTVDELKEDINILISMLKEDAAFLDGGKVSGDNNNFWTTFISILGLTLREGLEAILVIAAILAYLTKTNHHYAKKSVYLGAIIGIVFSIVLAYIFNYIADTIGASESGISQEIFEGVGMLVAVAVLFYVSNWMLQKAEVEVWNKYIQSQVDTSISKGSMYTLAFTSFLAVAREGAELIIFFQGLRENISNNPNAMYLGILISVLILVVVYILVAKLSIRLPLKPFFIATSWLMFILCISFLGKGIFELQEADVIGRTLIPWMHGFSIDFLGIYDRYETLIPQVILFIITIYTVILSNKNNKKKRQELEKQANLNN